MFMNRGIAAAVLVAMVFCTGCWSGDFNVHRYGIKAIALPDGRNVYLKREVGTIFFDRTALSQNGDRCVGPDGEADSMFVDEGAGEFPMYYAWSSDGLIVYDSELRPPSRYIWTLEIKQQNLRNLPYFGGRDEDYLAKGASKIQLLDGDLRTCK